MSGQTTIIFEPFNESLHPAVRSGTILPGSTLVYEWGAPGEVYMVAATADGRLVRGRGGEDTFDLFTVASAATRRMYYSRPSMRRFTAHCLVEATPATPDEGEDLEKSARWLDPSEPFVVASEPDRLLIAMPMYGTDPDMCGSRCRIADGPRPKIKALDITGRREVLVPFDKKVVPFNLKLTVGVTP